MNPCTHKPTQEIWMNKLLSFKFLGEHMMSFMGVYCFQSHRERERERERESTQGAFFFFLNGILFKTFTRMRRTEREGERERERVNAWFSHKGLKKEIYLNVSFSSPVTLLPAYLWLSWWFGTVQIANLSIRIQGHIYEDSQLLVWYMVLLADLISLFCLI